MTDLGQLIYTLTLNDEGFVGQLNQASGKVKESANQMTAAQDETAASSSKLKGAFSGMAGQFVAGAVIFTIGQKALTGVKDAIKDGINEAKSWQTQQVALRAELKQTGDAIGLNADWFIKLAEKTQAATGISRENALQSETAALVFNNISKTTMPAFMNAVDAVAYHMAGNMIPTGMQLQDVTTKLGRAFQDPTKYLGLLARSGITFTATQTDMIKQMQAAGDIQGAQNIMLQALQTRYGDASQALQTYNGQVQELKNRFNDLVGGAMRQLGEELDKILNFLARHKIAMEAVIGAVGALSLVIGGALVVAIFSAVAGFLALDGAALPWIAAALAIGAVIAILIAHWKAWHTEIELFLLVIAPFIGLPVLIVTHWNTVKQWFSEFWGWLRDMGSSVYHFFVDPYIDAFNTIKRGIQDVKNGLSSIAHAPGNLLSGIGHSIGNLLGFAQGGTVPGPVGAPMLAVVHGGETVIPVGGNGGGDSINYNFGQGSVVLSTPEATREFFNMGNRNTQLELQGGSPLAGTTGV